MIPIDCEDSGHHYCDDVCHVNTRICDGEIHCADESDEKLEQCESSEGKGFTRVDFGSFYLNKVVVVLFCQQVKNDSIIEIHRKSNSFHMISKQLNFLSSFNQQMHPFK